MHEVRRCFPIDNSAKKACLLHGFNLALLGVLLCTSLLSGPTQVKTAGTPGNADLKRTEVLSYEGQVISSVELAGRPDINTDEFNKLLALHSGDTFSADAIDQSVNALKRTGQFQDIEVNLRPELEGARVMFVLHPAVYFGVYQFPGAERFPYTQLLQAANYASQEPYSPLDVQKATETLIRFFRRNGFFEAEIKPEVQTDQAHGLANIHFKVTLNRHAKFGELIITGTTPEEADRLKDALQSLRARIHMSAVRPGNVYSLKTLQRAIDYLQSRLSGENHLAAQVKLIGANYNPKTNLADITFHVEAGPTVHAKIEGAHLWSWNRRKLLPIYEQNGLAPEMIEEGRQNLIKDFRQKGFFDVQVDADTLVRPDGVTIVYRVMKGERRKVEDIAFTGNEHFDSQELRQHVKVKKAGLLSRGSYDANSVRILRTFYQSKGFNQVTVTPEFNSKDKHTIVKFAITEGPQDLVESLRIEGNNSMSLKQLAPDGLSIAQGQPYAQKSIADDRNKIMSRYLDQGYLAATFRATAQPSAGDPHKFRVVYEIEEGPQVKTSDIVTVGQQAARQTLLERQTRVIEVGKPLTQRNIFESENRLYTTGVFDWAEVNPRRPVTTEEQAQVVVKVHEAHRNTMVYGFGYEFVNRGGSLPSGTVALPGLPPIGLPSTFTTIYKTFQGPRVNFLYTRVNVRGKGEMMTFGGLYGPLDRRLSFVYTDPNFRWTSWTASMSANGEYNQENPVFTSRQGQFGLQLQHALNAAKTENIFLRYTFTEVGLSNLLIPGLVPPEDEHTRLSTLAAVYVRDTRDNPLDAHKGHYDSVEFDVNPTVLGSNVSFARLLTQNAYYRNLNGVIWANSLRLGFEGPTPNSHVPISQKFFTGGGSTLRGFPLNGAGPQKTTEACGNPLEPSTCTLIQVPTGGPQLFILNSEFRIPLPIKKGLGFVAFYDGGNVFDRLGFKNFTALYTNSVGLGLRYATPVGPIRFDVGHNLNPLPGVSSTQFFITLGQAF